MSKLPSKGDRIYLKESIMEQINIRKPAVAGRFYPAEKEALSTMIKDILNHENHKIDLKFIEKPIYGAVVPHAGYMFSACHAVHFFDLIAKIEKKVDTFVIINPNHTGFGEKISMESHKYWSTPLGNIQQDMEFITELGFPFSDIAHEHEHAGEVMLPLLQYFIQYDFKIAMITFSQQNAENAKEIAKRIKETEQKLNRNVMIIASSDFTHFKDSETGKKLDDIVLEQIMDHKTDMVYRVVKDNNISVCGYGPIMSLMEYSSFSGNYSTTILARGHSGQIIPSDKVVDYVTILFSKE